MDDTEITPTTAPAVGRSPRRKAVEGLGAAAVLVVAVGVGLVPADAAETSRTACPSSVDAYVNDSSTAYPPFATPAAEDTSALVDCTGTFTPTVDNTNLELRFALPDLPAEDCVVVTSLTVRSTGTPGGGGWGISAWDPTDSSPIRLASGTADGGFQQHGASAGNQIPSNGIVFETDVDQPAAGAYSVGVAFDPTVLSAAQLATTGVGVSLVVINSADVIDAVQVEAVVDDAACAPGTSVPTTSTTSTTAAPAVAPAGTFSPAPQPVAAQPTFTG